LRRFLAAVVFAVVLSPAQAQQVEPGGELTLREALRNALAHNPGAAISRSDVEAAQRRVRLARSSILPQIYLDGRYTRNDREVVFDFDGTQVPILPENDWSTSVTLSQPVFAGGRELKAIRQARLGVNESEEALRQTEAALLLDVAANYLGVVGADALLIVEQQNLELATGLRRQSIDFYEAGEVTRVDVLRAETSLRGAERQLAFARQSRQTAASLLRLAMGVDVEVDAVRPVLDLPPLPPEEELIAMATERRPEIQRARLVTEVARLEVEKQKGAYLPLVTAQASFTQQASAFPSDQTGAVTVNMSMPIFTSGELSARVATARQQEKQAQILREQTEQIVREDVRRALVQLETAERQLALSTDQREAAEAEYAQTFELYRAQEATSLDVQAAEANLASARRTVVTSTLDRDLAELHVWYTAGAIRPVLLEESR
jgi:outer membrane protein